MYIFLAVFFPRVSENCPPENCSQKAATCENCLLWKYPPMKFLSSENPSLEINPKKLVLYENFPLLTTALP